MADFPNSPQAIENRMNGELVSNRAVLPCSQVQSHAAYLAQSPNGELSCVWFAGSLEGNTDISIYRSKRIGEVWQDAQRLTDDANRSEQNPILFYAPDGRELLIHTAQPAGGNQDECVVRMREIGKDPVDMPFPPGTFVRSAPKIREDGAWMLPLFHCTPKNGARWTGRHDTASVAISKDAGVTWKLYPVPDSIGCVHMTLVPSSKGGWVAFFRRRQADYVFRCESDAQAEIWSAPRATNLPNNNSSIAAIKLADGRIALCCNPNNADISDDRRESLYDELGGDDRPEADGGCGAIWGVPRAPLVIAFSKNDGELFSEMIKVADSTGRCLSNNSLDGRNQELSYPSMLESIPGILEVAFTLHRRAIAHRRINLTGLEDY